MGRAIILILCLVTAGAIAAYSNDVRAPADSTDKIKVYAVPARIEAPAIPSAPSPLSVAADVPADKAALTRQLQRELKRVGCYTGDINGVWTTSSRLAMKAFVDHANASLPIHAPDPVLLSLVRGHPDGTCAAPCPRGRICEPIPPASKSGDEQASVVPATVTTAIAASAAVAAATSSKTTTKAAPAPDLAASPPPAEPETRKGVRERKPRQTWKDPVKPPRFVRDFLRTVERTFKLP